MEPTTGRAAYRACRDLLVRYRDDYAAAITAFGWPDVGDQFNWALDWFDHIARGSNQSRAQLNGSPMSGQRKAATAAS